VAAISGALLDSLGTGTPSSPIIVSTVYLLSTRTGYTRPHLLSMKILAPG